MDETTTQVQESGNRHDNNFTSITLRFFQEIINLFKYIFYDVLLGRKPQ